MRIDPRYSGPPASGNGVVTCGLLASHVHAPVVEVSLRQPPPLDVELRVAASIGVGRRGCGTSYAGLVDHPFPGCFVPGRSRSRPGSP